MRENLQGVAWEKGASAEGEGVAAGSWAIGEYPLDCRICGELWINEIRRNSYVMTAGADAYRFF